jgi:hypothetical protein
MSRSGSEARKLFAVNFDGTRVGLVGTGNNLDESGFACAIFAEEGVDFTETKIEGDTFESGDGAEGFGDLVELEEGVQPLILNR